MAPPFTKLPYIETSPKRVRVSFNDTCLVDTTKAKLVWEHSHYPAYFFLVSDVASQYISDAQDIVVGDRRLQGAVSHLTEGELKGLVKIASNRPELKWMEEDFEVKAHPRDPYTRVDVLPSSRHIRVEVSGVEVANSHQPRLLFETGLITRYYLPRDDCRMDLLEDSKLNTYCPYKGTARYYNVRLPDSGTTVENIVWYYADPYAECTDLKGYIAFYDEKVDVWVDGVKVERPKTPFRDVSA